ncbi:MAG: retron system putative HNH endonuclease [Pirellulaceae bacterium]
MRAITKGKEPASLAEHRANPGADYEGADKDDLRFSLVTEQRGLCCYCLSRIRPELGSMKIEHWHSQKRYPAEQLDYTNLLGACMGNEGQSPRYQHCDTHKANRDLSRNPANPSHRVADLIRYAPDGTIRSDDKIFDQELNSVLNLNIAVLKSNRKAVLDGFLGALPRHGDLPRSTVEKWLRDWNGDSGSGELQPFNQVIVYWLRKRLRA